MNGQRDTITDDGHVLHLASSYVLSMLPNNERELVVNHMARCQDCQLAISKERRIGIAVRDTVASATQTHSPDFQQLMPSPPSNPRTIYRNKLQFRLAFAGLLLLIILGGIGLQYDFNQHRLIPNLATAYSTSVAATDTPGITFTASRADVAPIRSEYIVLPTPNARISIPIPRPAIAPVHSAPLLH